MLGIVLASHGDLAHEMLQTSKLFLGDEIPQYECACLHFDDDIDQYTQRLKDICAKVDTGDGVLIICDLLFGSPCNCSLHVIGDKVDVITGMNLPLVLEILTSRQSGPVDVDAMVETAQSGIANLKKVVEGIN